jgi:hypothetical protein
VGTLFKGAMTRKLTNSASIKSESRVIARLSCLLTSLSSDDGELSTRRKLTSSLTLT